MSANLHDYEDDHDAWALNQAALLRAGQLDALDIGHIADELEEIMGNNTPRAASPFPCLDRAFAQVAIPARKTHL